MRFPAACLFLFFVVLLPGCSPALYDDEPDTPVTIRVLSFNILYGGDEVDFSKMVEAIRGIKAILWAFNKATSSDYYQSEQQTNYLLYAYTMGLPNGRLALDSTAKGEGWPLKPGKYDLHFLLDDGYTSLDSLSFTVIP